LLDELPAIRTQRGVEELDRGDAIQVGGLARLPHAIERAHHVLLAPDHVERGQLTQPPGRRFRRQQRVGMVPRLLGQKSEHCSACNACERKTMTHRRTAQFKRSVEPRFRDGVLIYSPIPPAAQKRADVGYNRGSR
jgi:hypothetical protein